MVGVEPAYVLAPLWSLSIEEQFYLTFPVIVASVSRRQLQRVLVAMLFLAPVFRLSTFLAFPANERIQYLATFSRLDVLSLGGLVALMARTSLDRVRKWPAGRWLIGLSAAMVVTFALGGLDRMRPFCRIAGYSLVGFTFAALLTWTIQHRGSRRTAFLRCTPLCYLGKLCYGMYLLQRPAEIILMKVSARVGIAWWHGSPVLLMAKCLAALGLAMASYHVFEVRVLSLKRLFTSARHPSLRPASNGGVAETPATATAQAG